MTASRLLFALLTGLAVSSPSLAQTVAGDDQAVATAAHRLDARAAAQAETAPVVPAPPVRALTTEEQIAAFLTPSPLGADRDGEEALADSAAGPVRRIHGSVGVSVGTGGYRSAYVAAQIPIGETSTLGLAYSQTDYGKTAVFYPYGDRGFGPGGYDQGGWTGHHVGLGQPGYWGRGGQNQSLAVSLAVGVDRQRPPEGCAPAFRTGDQFVEPLWATRMRGQASPCSGEDAH